jgi:hypothetical protein
MKPAKNQLPLSYEAPFDERMAVFRAQLDTIDPADVDLTPTQWDRVCTLLRAVFAFASGQWDRYAQVDPERLQDSAELSRRQVSEAKCLARDAGLLRSERHYPRRYEHRLPDKLWVVRERLDELVLKARVRNRAQPCSNRAQPGAHKETHSLPISQSNSGRQRATGEILPRDGCDPSPPKQFSGSDPASIQGPDPQVALKFLKAIGGRYTPRDAALAWKLAGLASVLGEAWLWNIAEAVRAIGPTRPWAYVWRVAAEGSHELPGPGEGRLKRLLARSGEPPDGWPVRNAGPDFSQRLCAAGYDED